MDGGLRGMLLAIGQVRWNVLREMWAAILGQGT
jgi:hypothetical protein